MSYSTSQIRNVALAGHSGAGNCATGGSGGEGQGESTYSDTFHEGDSKRRYWRRQTLRNRH